MTSGRGLLCIRRGSRLTHVLMSLILTRWRRVLVVVGAAALLMAFSCQLGEIVKRHKRSWFFPRITCPEFSITTTSSSTTRDQSSQVIHRIQLGNWSFQAPHQLTHACSGDTLQGGRLLALVPVTAEMTAERTALRHTWGSQLNSSTGQLVFLIQLSQGEAVTPSLRQEFDSFHDILLASHSGEFSRDSYGLLVRKVIAGLRWYAENCSTGFDYVMKADHDSYWNVPSLLRLLRRHQPSEPLVFGSIQEGAVVSREVGSKFFTPKEQFAAATFPTYASGGPGYVMSRSAAVAVSAAAARASRGAFWLEDVFLTGQLPEVAFPECVQITRVSDGTTSHVGFRHLHSDYVFICRYSEFSQAMVSNWPPLAMHRVQGPQLMQLHEWMLEPGMDAQSELRHNIVYSKLLCQAP